MCGPRPVPSAHRDSFHGAMCPALMVAQCFALLPVDGISRNHPGVPQFRWLSFRVFYTVAVFTGTGVVALLAAYRMIREGLSFSSSGESGVVVTNPYARETVHKESIESLSRVVYRLDKTENDSSETGKFNKGNFSIFSLFPRRVFLQ